MVKLIIQYPREPGAFFDFDYYSNVHMPLGERLLSAYGLLGYEISRCTETVAGDEAALFCLTELRFNDAAGLRRGLQEQGAQLKADFSNYTDISPVIMLAEVI